MLAHLSNFDSNFTPFRRNRKHNETSAVFIGSHSFPNQSVDAVITTSGKIRITDHKTGKIGLELGLGM